MSEAAKAVSESANGGAAAKSNPLDPKLFRPEAISAEQLAANEAFGKAVSGGPDWWDMGAAAYREMVASGRGPIPPAPKSERARTIQIEGKGGHKIGLRVIEPERGAATGVYLHIHGGGFVFGSSQGADPMLERVVRSTGMVATSVEYRLAPEHPYPAGWDDCESVAAWLAKNAESEFGSGALTIGGESAGATLAVTTLLRMRDRHGYTGFRAANLSYGNYDTSMTPSQALSPERGLLVGRLNIRKFTEAYLPKSVDARDPDVSPLYARLNNMPPAIFSVGTLDPLLDDSLFMYSRWIAAGNEAELALYPGAPHVFNMMPMPKAAEANARIDAFLKSAVA